MNDKRPCLIIPDIHQKIGLVDRIRGERPGIPAIFLGDYSDDFHDTPAHMEVTCRWLKQAIGREQDMFLLGNHCSLISLAVGVSHPAFLAGTGRGGPARVGGVLWCDWNNFESQSRRQCAQMLSIDVNDGNVPFLARAISTTFGSLGLALPKTPWHRQPQQSN
jgi:hypothetical protein